MDLGVSRGALFSHLEFLLLWISLFHVSPLLFSHSCLLSLVLY